LSIRTEWTGSGDRNGLRDAHSLTAGAAAAAVVDHVLGVLGVDQDPGDGLGAPPPVGWGGVADRVFVEPGLC
jgi:hypothetical protein